MEHSWRLQVSRRVVLAKAECSGKAVVVGAQRDLFAEVGWAEESFVGIEREWEVIELVPGRSDYFPHSQAETPARRPLRIDDFRPVAVVLGKSCVKHRAVGYPCPLRFPFEINLNFQKPTIESWRSRSAVTLPYLCPQLT